MCRSCCYCCWFRVRPRRNPLGNQADVVSSMSPAVPELAAAPQDAPTVLSPAESYLKSIKSHTHTQTQERQFLVQNSQTSVWQIQSVQTSHKCCPEITKQGKLNVYFVVCE